MPTQVEIPDDFFTLDDKEKLKELFEVKRDQDFRKALNGVVLAGLEEYRDMFLGDGLPMRADDIRQFRLLYLIKHHFEHRIPNELEVSTMFQIPETRARNLIRYVLARFRNIIEQEILNTIETTLKGIRTSKRPNLSLVYIGADNIVEEINRIISLAGSEYRLLTKEQPGSHSYEISMDSLDKVKNYITKYKKPEPDAKLQSKKV
jgi:hypothetical protein